MVTVEAAVAAAEHEQDRAGARVALTLDVRDLMTPEPCLRLAAAVQLMEPGEIIEVLNNDPFSVSDIIRWCSYWGVENLELRYLPHGVDRFLLRRPWRKTTHRASTTASVRESSNPAQS